MPFLRGHDRGRDGRGVRHWPAHGEAGLGEGKDLAAPGDRGRGRVSAFATEHFRRVDAVFDAVLDLPTTEQAAYVDRACAGDAGLRNEVLQLLRAHYRTGSFLDSPAAHLAPLLVSAGEATGDVALDRIGPFRIVRSIGQGGMGQVFLGERVDGQFEQRVALKLISYPAPGLVRRFL